MLAACLALVCALSWSAPALAEETTTLLTEDFSGGQAAPNGWTDDQGYAWYWNDAGANDYDGSSVLDLWWNYAGPLRSPIVNTSRYSDEADVVVVEFDAYIERNYYHEDYGQEETLHIMAYVNGTETELLELNTTSDYTYYHENYDYTPYPQPGYWAHFTAQIPKDARGDDMQIGFYGSWLDWTASNIAIDNVTIWGTDYSTFSFTPTNVSFGEFVVGDVSEIRNVTITNPNADPIDISDIAISGPHAGDFELMSGVTSIAGGSTGTVGVRFSPGGTGTRNASLTFNANVDIDGNGVVSLTGVGVAPVISIGDTKNLFAKTKTQLGSSLDQWFIVTNTGSQGGLIVSPTTSIEGEHSDQYSVVQIPSFPILPGMSDTIIVRYSPTEEGSRPAELVVRSNASNGDQRIALMGTGILQRFEITPESFTFDSVGMGQSVCQTFTISNPGSDTLEIEDVYFASADADFTLVGLSDSLIAPERSRDIQVCFTPTGMGTRLARLRIITNIPNTMGENPQDTGDFYVNLMGTGVPYGSLSLSGNPTLDSSMIGEEICRTATLTNTGLSSITINGADIMGSDAGDFTIKDATYPMVIPAGGSLDVIVCATPGARGLRGAFAHLYSTTNGRMDTSVVPLGVYGLLTCAKTGSTTLFDNRTVAVGTADSMMIEITNCGDVATSYNAMIASANYQIIGSPMTGLVGPNETATFWVRFTPSAMGASSGNLQITGNGVQPIDIPLNGTGGAVMPANAAVNIPGTSVGSSNTFTVTVTNNGNMDWTTGAPDITTNAYSYAGGSVTIPAGGSHDFTFTFTPTVIGANNATVTFPNASPMPLAAYSIQFNGQGLASSVKTPSSTGGYTLMQNYPNPFNPSTTVRFTTPNSGVVRIDITDMTGEVVATAANEYFSAGTHEVKVDASALTSGTYFYVLSTGEIKLTRQMTLVK